jgi:hypothetical protein
LHTDLFEWMLAHNKKSYDFDAEIKLFMYKNLKNILELIPAQILHIYCYRQDCVMKMLRMQLHNAFITHVFSFLRLLCQFWVESS